MSSADAEAFIRDFLRHRGGSASAGEVVARAAEHGLAASTVRRAADECVTKSRRGSRFVWALVEEPEVDPVTEGGDPEQMERQVLEARAAHLEIDLEPYGPEVTDEELQALIEDAEDGVIYDAPLTPRRNPNSPY